MSSEQNLHTLPETGGDKLFTLESANQALVLVRRVVADIVSCYKEMLALRQQRETLAVANTSGDQIAVLDQRLETLVERLSLLQEELAGIGCLLKDWAAGLVDFPAMHQGRVVYLCWRLGEERIEHWHDVQAGFAGRRPAAELSVDE